MKNEKSNQMNLRTENISKRYIEEYLSDVKRKIQADKYRIDRSDKRQDNKNLFLDFIIDYNKAKEILLKLTYRDFSEILQNEHAEYKEEKLYVFGKNVALSERVGNKQVIVPLYIKINNLKNGPVIIISFHKQKHPLTYYFSRR